MIKRRPHPTTSALLLALTLLLCANAAARPPTLLVLGDSLSAAFGIPQHTGWVTRLTQRLQRQGRPYAVINASLSGETTGGGLARLPSLLAQHRPAVVILALGSNDGLQGKPIALIRQTLTALARQAKSAGARVMLVGNHILPNYGPRYTQAFFQSFADIARQETLAYAPWMLKDIATEPSLMQADGLHPTAAAQTRILDNLWPPLEPLLSP